MFSSLTKEIQEAFLAEYPKEGCGVIAGGRFIKMPNISDDPENHFYISQSRIQKLDKPLQAVVHSHPDASPVPSKSDMQLALNLKKPVGVLRTDKNGGVSGINWYNDGVKRPLVGSERYFVHGITDCYSLIIDYFREKRGIELKDWPRDWGWWDKDENMYDEFFGETGFKEVGNIKDLRPDDVLFINIGRNAKSHHAGIYEGNDLFIHHPGSLKPIDNAMMARRDIIHRWAKYITKVVRYDA